jgi:hypothetical protein
MNNSKNQTFYFLKKISKKKKNQLPQLDGGLHFPSSSHLLAVILLPNEGQETEISRPGEVCGHTIPSRVSL